ncbi:MAG: hypothetical protein HPY76_05850 [Anaerolineae bacterium]|nr:hypothetical protein [Anaerolineae bacterium]
MFDALLHLTNCISPCRFQTAKMQALSPLPRPTRHSEGAQRPIAKQPTQLREEGAARRRDLHSPPFEIASPPAAAREVERYTPRAQRPIAKQPTQLREEGAARRRDLHSPPFEIASPPAAAREVEGCTPRAQRSDPITPPTGTLAFHTSLNHPKDEHRGRRVHQP